MITQTATTNLVEKEMLQMAQGSYKNWYGVLNETYDD